MLRWAEDTETIDQPPKRLSSVNRSDVSVTPPPATHNPPVSGYALALSMSDQHLFDHKLGLLSPQRDTGRRRNRGKGREWEYPAIAELYEDGNLVHRSIVGTRHHGDYKYATMESFTQETCLVRKRNFRIYNRSKIRPLKIPSKILRPEVDRSQFTFVVRRKRPITSFVSTVIASEIGAEVSASGLINFAINHSHYCTAVISEHVSMKQFQVLSEKGFVFKRFKDSYSNPEKYEMFSEWAFSSATADGVRRLVDIENFNAAILTHLYLANTDWQQGAFVYSPSSKKWRWILWDLDVSFRRIPLEWPSIPTLMRRNNVQSKLFGTLLRDSAYRQQFLKFARNVLTEKLDQDFLDSLLHSIPDSIQDHHNELPAIRDAFRHRSQSLLADLEDYFEKRKWPN